MDEFSKYNKVDNENYIMLGLALGVLIFNLIGFIVTYFVWREYSDKSDYIRVNGAKLLDFSISFWLYSFGAGLLCIVMIGFILAPIAGVTYIVLAILGIIKYLNGQDYDYKFSLSIFNR